MQGGAAGDDVAGAPKLLFEPPERIGEDTNLVVETRAVTEKNVVQNSVP